jgi:lipoic acid synthetase
MSSVARDEPRSTTGDHVSLPRWLKRNVPKGAAGRVTAETAGVLDQLGLNTVCRHAGCPNRMECYARRTATFMILGEVCTRGCRFCNVRRGRPEPVDPDEPTRVAEAVRRLGLRHVVVTCVTRDDLPDGGAAHFVATIDAIRAATRETPDGPATVEVLPSDFAANRAAVEQLVDARPEVYNHNAETVPRLYRSVRGPKLEPRWTLDMFRLITRRDPTIQTKTGIMLGLGETDGEVVDWLAELHAAGCRLLTLGQYLQPNPTCLPVDRFVEPRQFERLGDLARHIGYEQVAAGPFVRSSYHAREMLHADGATPEQR